MGRGLEVDGNSDGGREGAEDDREDEDGDGWKCRTGLGGRYTEGDQGLKDTGNEPRKQGLGGHGDACAVGAQQQAACVPKWQQLSDSLHSAFQRAMEGIMLCVILPGHGAREILVGKSV